MTVVVVVVVRLGTVEMVAMVEIMDTEAPLVRVVQEVVAVEVEVVLQTLVFTTEEGLAVALAFLEADQAEAVEQELWLTHHPLLAAEAALVVHREVTADMALLPAVYMAEGLADLALT